MSKFHTIHLGFLPLILYLSLISCSSYTDIESAEKPVNHIVLAWFKVGTTQAEISEIMVETKKLVHIPQVQSLQLGRAIVSDREIVDDSFDLGIRFLNSTTKENMNTYLSHPKHTAFIKTFVKPKLAKILVYDF